MSASPEHSGERIAPPTPKRFRGTDSPEVIADALKRAALDDEGNPFAALTLESLDDSPKRETVVLQPLDVDDYRGLQVISAIDLDGVPHKVYLHSEELRAIYPMVLIIRNPVPPSKPESPYEN